MAVRYGLNVAAEAEDQFDEIHWVNADEVKRRMTSMFEPRKRRTTLVRNVRSSTSPGISDIHSDLPRTRHSGCMRQEGRER